MKKNFRVIKLDGLTGLFLAITAVVIVVASVVSLPVYGIKFLWNHFLNGYFDVQTIRLSQASLLWFAIIAMIYGYFKSKIHFKFVNVSNFSDAQMNNMDYEKFIEKIKEEQKENEKINH
ncbi:MAG: hypothetical protein MJ180_01940 [Candidatus Gastranaerophilales bacterium]|nr:hypothetical protein [Candidatus Gastranaerophilales bacterium]